MNSQHTPGPWKANKWAPGWSVSAPLHGLTVCMLPERDNSDANARLIAAAPDLLAALHIALESMDAIHVPQEWDTRSVIRAAIARARGQQ